MISFWLGLSVLGSMAVMGPAGAAVGVWLAGGRSWRLAFSWCLLFGVGMALVVATKIAFIGWGIGVYSVQFAGFSGHAMRAGAVLPVLFFVLLKGVRPAWRWTGVAAGALLAVLITLSRLELRLHSVSEGVTGCLLGLLVAALFIWYALGVAKFAISRTFVVLSFCCLLFAPKAEPVPTEAIITRVALRMSGHVKPFDREEWRIEQQQYLLR